MDKLSTRAPYDTVSIRMIRGPIAKGQPGGKNKPKKPDLWSQTPITFIPIKVAKARENVFIKELVTV
jgi:hypothetical protein